LNVTYTMIHRLIMKGFLVLILSYANMADDEPSFTAGNTMCRNGGHCGYANGTSHSWCYIDYNGKWDYCCTTQCENRGKNYLLCSSGSQQEYFCGDAGKKDIHGRNCLPSHPCGLHHGENKPNFGFFWCYVDINHTWGKCCHPDDTCTDKGQGYSSCRTGIMPNEHIAN
ncbi:hypothetical protein ACJMK2_001075, partial [Sinanodonta woodiana]